MSKENFDDLAMFCGDKDFYDLDGNGHLDDFEAAMMVGDVADELEGIERTPPRTYSSASSSTSTGYFYPLLMLGLGITTVRRLLQADLVGMLWGLGFMFVFYLIHSIRVENRKAKGKK
jgi:hypothetical protein